MRRFLGYVGRGLRATVAAGVVIVAVTAAAVQSTPEAAAEARPDSFADLAERVVPAVVNISTTQTLQGRRMPQFPPGSPFEEYFRDFFEGDREGTRPRRVTSLGSGFVVDPGGFIVTNNHVISDADSVIVRFHDDTTLDATVVGRDPKTDIALLKVDPPATLAHLEFGDSDAARVGDWVIAIGNPFGLGGTVTAGIISARQRDIRAGPYDDFLQTDASINQGNSGGPMLDLEGRVIGINTAIFSPSGGSVGIGFAVPSALAQPIIDQLMEFGETRRGWIGVRIQTVTDAIADSLGLDEPRGALVASVIADGPAETAGIERGDIILGFDGRSVDAMRRLPRVVADTPVGRAVEVELWRDGAREVVTLEVGRLEEAEAGMEAATVEGQPEHLDLLGIQLAVIGGRERDRWDLPADVQGLVVTEVDPDGPAAERDVRPGDVIVEIDQNEVATLDAARDIVRAAADQGRRTVLLLIDRGSGDLRFVPVTLADPTNR